MNIHDISVGMDALLPALFEVRLLALIVGSFIVVHFFCMSGFMHPKSSWTSIAIVASNAGSGAGLIIGALIGSVEFLMVAGIVSATALTTLQMWLWWRGMHISEFLVNQN